MESIVCPGCQRPIRVTEETLGQRAECPFCKCYFQAPARTAHGALTEPRLLKRNPFAESRTLAPGALLLIIGLFAMLANAVEVGKAYSDPEAFEEQTRTQMAAQNLEEYADRTVKWMPRTRIGFLCLSGLVAAGGLAMIRKRYHGLAMIASVAALFNVASCCCVIGFPAGAWALFVLRDPKVRASFGPRATQAS